MDVRRHSSGGLSKGQRVRSASGKLYSHDSFGVAFTIGPLLEKRAYMALAHSTFKPSTSLASAISPAIAA